jgi:hypothetical protein
MERTSKERWHRVQARCDVRRRCCCLGVFADDATCGVAVTGRTESWRVRSGDGQADVPATVGSAREQSCDRGRRGDGVKVEDRRRMGKPGADKEVGGRDLGHYWAGCKRYSANFELLTADDNAEHSQLLCASHCTAGRTDRWRAPGCAVCVTLSGSSCMRATLTTVLSAYWAPTQRRSHDPTALFA